MIEMTADERVARGYDIPAKIKQTLIASDLAYWRTKAPADGTVRSQFDAVLANYGERRISRSDALVAIRAIEAGRSPAPKAVRRPGSTIAEISPDASQARSLPTPPASHDPDDVSAIFESAGYGQQPTESTKVAQILADHRQVTGSSPDRDQQVVDGIFASAGYPPKAAAPSGSLTSAEQAHVEQILGDHQAITGIQRRSQSAEGRADTEAVDKIFASAGYPPRAEAQDPKVREILSDHRAVTGR